MRLHDVKRIELKERNRIASNHLWNVFRGMPQSGKIHGKGRSGKSEGNSFLLSNSGQFVGKVKCLVHKIQPLAERG